MSNDINDLKYYNKDDGSELTNDQKDFNNWIDNMQDNAHYQYLFKLNDEDTFELNDKEKQYYIDSQEDDDVVNDLENAKHYRWFITDNKEFDDYDDLENGLDYILIIGPHTDYDALSKEFVDDMFKECGTYDKSLQEDIEKHNELNPKLFNEDNTLKEEVRNKILEIVDEFKKDLEEDDIELKVKDIIIAGSNASYNYTKDSDLDVHIIASIKKLKEGKNLYPVIYSLYRRLFNKKYNITFYGIPVEIYVETENEDDVEFEESLNEAQEQNKLVSNGIYSVLNNKWIKEPVQEDIPEIDMDKFNKEFSKWEDRYNKLIAEDYPLDESLILRK